MQSATSVQSATRENVTVFMWSTTDVTKASFSRPIVIFLTYLALSPAHLLY